ncbi:MAG: dephospho-CoA kinase [Candidatus Pacebacteria bacterium]|nr:dephospho-CoA kinase [Candidatus Paceibacterota bacterium]
MNPFHSLLASTQSRRLGRLRRPMTQRPIVLVITGSIGGGKTTLSNLLREARIAVFDSDQRVHRMMAVNGRAVSRVARDFPESLRFNPQNQPYIDRVSLGNCVFADDRRLKILESILHPMVELERKRFLQNPPRLGPKRPCQRRIMAIDSPLYFERLQTGGSRVFTRPSDPCNSLPNWVIATVAPDFLQKQRVMNRPRMTAAKFAGITAKQLPSGEKSLRADYSIPSGIGKAASRRRLRLALTSIRSIT